MTQKPKKSSQTALVVALIRAASYLEHSSVIHSNDSFAHYFLPFPFDYLIQIKAIRRYIQTHLPDKLFDYIVSRTNYIDSVWHKAIKNGINQVVILGAGYDSRGLRLDTTEVCVFEVDKLVTQQAKIQLLEKRNIDHAHIRYIPLDLGSTSLQSALQSSGFDVNKSTLFIMEGLLMYLDPKVVDTLLGEVKSICRSKCEAVFDIMYSINASKSTKIVTNLGEPFLFCLEKQKIRSFMKTRGLELIEIIDANRPFYGFVRIKKC